MQPEIAAAVEQAVRLQSDRPLTIVFASAGYKRVLANWLRHASAAGATNILVLALDEEITTFTTNMGIASARLPAIASRQELWFVRIDMFAALARSGVNFIHSDADAVWISSPYEVLFQPGIDATFSQGTRLPPELADRWGFVLCCGLFAVRSSEASARFFDSVRTRMAADGDDQAAVNRVLDDMAIQWRMPAAGERRYWKDQPFTVFPHRLVGRAGPLTISMLPHWQVPRLPERTADAMIVHPVGMDPAEVKLLRLGAWDGAAVAEATRV